MDVSAGKILSLGFCMFCILLTIFLSALQLMKYFENNDSSSFKYREFHATSQDQYPLFTFCYEKSENELNGPNLLNKDYLEKIGINGIELQNSLSGKESNLTHDLYSLDYNNLMPRLKDTIKMFYVNTLDCKLTWYSDRSKKDEIVHCKKHKLKKEEPMIKSYQDPEKVCFTRNNDFGPQKVRTHEKLMINWEFLKAANGTFRIYHHNKQQFQRRICKYIISKETSMIIHGKLEFWVSEVTLLRRRVDANDPCDPIVNDDEQSLNMIMKQVNCTPPYWKSMFPKVAHYPDCKDSKQLKDISDIITEPAKMIRVFDKYTMPCNKMSSTVTFHMKPAKEDDDKKLYLEFNYLEDTYQEVFNQKDFGLEMLGSSIGGFIGMFLGYSLLQCPELIGSIVGSMKKFK